ncbi:MAG: hypothetical protein ACXWTL_09070 [Methylobacter sp.]
MRNLLFMMLLACSTSLLAAPRIGHHGDMVMKCHKPMFFGEIPANEAKVKDFQKFSFNASANTDIATLKVWVNNQAINVDTKQQASSRYLVTGQIDEPIHEGKAWLKVTSESNDGCNALKVWNVFIQ